MNNKEKYKDFCRSEVNIPIFSQYWWLDAVCGHENWDAVIIEKGGLITATLPYMLVNKYGLCFITMPPLTKALGPWLRAYDGKIAAQYAHQKELFTKLIQSLPRFDYFCQNFHPMITNWLPFFWQGFKQTTFYTYVLDDLRDLQKIFNGFQGNARREIKKAEQRYKLHIRWDIDIDSFLDLYEMTFSRQKIPMPHSKEIVHRIDATCASRNARKIIGAEDAEGRLHAALYIIWDQHSAYYLMGGSEPNLRNSGAKSFCMWEAIKFASKVTQRFDFEGSMLQPVERFFRGFGAKQIPYFRITCETKLMKRLRALKNLIQPK
ncbi:MAG: GNAT family N-acetyltransferase [Desulfobacterales bacterium]|nr:MAG: GNAT family N-acetyltransferase [Desulfobacterales bacterium]